MIMPLWNQPINLSKSKFVHQYQFETLAQLRLELFDYVHWWNYLRLHGTLAYESTKVYFI
ncbi:hypothetical protein EfmJHP9_08390 [Enterococcus faecium]|nr:hypothetical protein EfmJHP9_08390 [Enterococcus faecium]